VCTGGDGVPGGVGEALAMMGAALDYLNGPGGDLVETAGLGGVLHALAGIDAKHAAARMRFLSRFDANDCHDSDGYPTTASWLAGRTNVVLAKARAEVRKARQLAGSHPGLAAALAAGELSPSWAAGIAEWTKQLPADIRTETDRILIEAAGAGADFGDLKIIATAASEAYRGQQPDPDEDDRKFDERFLHVDTTLDGAGRITGDLTPECAAAVQAVVEALGKRRGKEDDRTAAQRMHDALQEGCELLIRAKMVPDRAGADTRVDVHIALSQLRGLDGAGVLEEAWLAARAGEHGFLAGKDAQAVACDALLVPVVTASPDWAVIGQMITLVLDALGQHTAGPQGSSPKDLSPQATPQGAAAAGPPPLPVPPAAWEGLQYALAKLAIDFVSGPGALASVLRTGLLGAPFNTKSVPIDVGYSENIPEPIRRAVILRDKKCAWPGGCDKRPAACDVHHVKHKKNGGPTSVRDCILLCQYHHDICIHRWGWEIELLPDGSVKAYGPQGQVIRSHGPPPAYAA
jgi:Domain of unknown function (DUF222)